MYVIFFNWAAVPIFYGSLAVGGAAWFLLSTLGLESSAFFMGLALTGMSFVVSDYRERRRDVMAMPLWRLVQPTSGGHIFFIPCWVIGAVCILGAGFSLADIANGVGRRSLASALVPCSLLGFMFPPAYDFLRPFGRSRWARPERSDDEAFRPE